MKMLQKCISGFLAMLVLLTLLPVQAWAAEISFEELPEVPKLPQQAVAGEPLDIHLSFTSQEDKTAEELYEAYAKQTFFPASSDSVGLNGVGAGRELSGDTRVIYDALKVLIERVANGERSSAVFTIGQPIEYDGENYPVDIITEFSGSSFTQNMFNRILNALVLDMPYELYWFDRVSGCELIGGFINEYGYLAQLTFGFTVAEDYRDDDVYAADTDKTGAASNAAANARDIVASYAKASDYEKLLGYQNEIHDLVSYDFDAAEGMYFTEEIDPWQLISVFDGDDTTNVVCEGYAKAYMYLCDLTTFTEDIECYVVSGYMEGVAHMWNIVDMAGKHYLVDTTNNDTGTVCENGGLFLAGGIGSPVDGYYVDGLFYYYEDALKNLWGTGTDSILTLRASSYDPTGTERDLVAAGVCGDNMVWMLDSEGLFSVVGTDAMYDFTESGMPWVNYLDAIKTIEISEGITYIGRNAFPSCSNLTNVSFPSSITHIGYCAFNSCSRLTKLVLPEGVTVIGERSFAACSRLASATIPSTVTEIQSGAFMGCSALKAIKLPENLESIGSRAFSGCDRLTELTIPSKIKTIEDNTFEECKRLTTVILPEGLTSIGNYAFRYCPALTNVPIPTTVTHIGFQAFASSGITSVQLPEGLISFGGSAFSGCYQLTSVVIPDTITVIGDSAFSSCTSLKSIKLPAQLTHIGDVAFAACTSLTEITIPDKVTHIGGSAFYNCGSLKTVTIPSSVTFIGWNAFGLCESLTDIYYAGTEDQWNQIENQGQDDPQLTATIHFRDLDTPTITKLENTAEGVKITWGAVDGAAQYRVYYKTTGGWTKITDTTDTSFVWTGAKSGTTYAFTVRCLNAAGNAFTSEANTTGWKHTYIAQPAISKLESTGEGVKITWGKVGGAERYRIYLKSGNSWKVIGNTTDTSFVYTGAEIGTTYTFTVRCFDAENKVGTSTYSNTGWSHKYNPVPRISALTSEAGGIKITWDPIKGVEKYRVYVKTDTGWKKLTDTTAAEYVYTGAKLGETYTFTVRGIGDDGKSYTTTYSNAGWSHKYYPSPVISKLTNTAEGVKVTWKAINGAVRYRVYVKTATGGWKNVGNTDGTSFVWTGAKSGTVYSFTIRCVTEDNASFTSAYNTTGWQHTFIAQPAIAKLESQPEGVKVTWDAVTGAVRYRVYVKAGTGWKNLGSTTDTSFVWADATAGKTYTFTVRCVDEENKVFTSAFSETGWNHKFYPTPAFSAMESVPGGVKLSWNAVKGAATYRVYVQDANGAWKKLTDTAETSFTWADAKLGESYTFTLRGMAADGKTYVTTYNSAGWSHKYYPAPEIAGLESVPEGVSITWSPINGAARYRVYLKSGTSWKVIGNTTENSFLYTDAVAGESYTFTVRCVDDANKFTTSDYSRTGWSITHN